MYTTMFFRNVKKEEGLMKRNFILATGVIFVFLCIQSVRAEMFSFSKSMGGTINDVRPDAISLTPSAAKDTTPIDLQINDSTKLKDLQAVTDLKKGDAVRVKYKEQDGKKIAVQVEKDQNAANSQDNLQMNQGQGANNEGAAKQDTPTRDQTFQAI